MLNLPRFTSFLLYKSLTLYIIIIYFWLYFFLIYNVINTTWGKISVPDSYCFGSIIFTMYFRDLQPGITWYRLKKMLILEFLCHMALPHWYFYPSMAMEFSFSVFLQHSQCIDLSAGKLTWSIKLHKNDQIWILDYIQFVWWFKGQFYNNHN